MWWGEIWGCLENRPVSLKFECLTKAFNLFCGRRLPYCTAVNRWWEGMWGNLENQLSLNFEWFTKAFSLFYCRRVSYCINTVTLTWKHSLKLIIWIVCKNAFKVALWLLAEIWIYNECNNWRFYSNNYLGRQLNTLDVTALTVRCCRLYLLLVPFCCFLLPTWVPMHFFGESFWIAWNMSILRYTLSLNFTWLVNSAAHIWGMRPYEKYLQYTY